MPSFVVSGGPGEEGKMAMGAMLILVGKWKGFMPSTVLINNL
jgi:hypothetical protein